MRTLLALIIALMIFPIANAVLIDGLQTSVTHNSATFTFTTTETADTVINYGNNTLKSQTITDESFVTDHSITITGLYEDTPYYYDIISTTQTGSQTIKPGNFRTADITPPPKVSGFEIGEITRTSVEFDWENVAVSDFEIYFKYNCLGIY